MILDSQIAQASGVVSQRIDDTVVLLRIDGAQYYTLEEVGALVWDLCDGTTGFEQMVAAVCQEYAAASEDVEADVRELLTDFASEGLITVGG